MFTCTAIFVVVYITCEVNREVLEAAAGGFNLALKDVHNAGKSWLATNKPSSSITEPPEINFEPTSAYNTVAAKDPWQFGSCSEILLLKLYLTRDGDNMNHLKWYLTTLMVRTEYASWIPAAHFFHQFQDSDIIAAGLRKSKNGVEIDGCFTTF
jgi:hypothetical protein